MANKIKHPSTPHLPWSQEVAGDDKFIDSLTPFLGRFGLVKKWMGSPPRAITLALCMLEVLTVLTT
mgnify:CR=1 FL=1